VVIQARLTQSKPTNRRASPRRKISLESSLQVSGDSVAIHDLSPTGLLLETPAKLQLLGSVDIDLPEAAATRAIVVWNSGRYYGCQFKEPLPKRVISAALLRSQPKPPEAPAQRRAFVIVPPKVGETRAVKVQETITTLDEEKASLSVRLRVIMGSALLLWALIIWTVCAVIRLSR
jgi:PilZ domain